MFAANISTVHLVSLAESAYVYGLGFTGNFEWMAGSTLILLSLFFAPLYLRSRVPTLPEFLERRYNRQCRDWLAVISIISAIVLHMGIALFTAAAAGPVPLKPIFQTRPPRSSPVRSNRGRDDRTTLSHGTDGVSRRDPVHVSPSEFVQFWISRF